jgi:OPT family small oligopeptide transporter
VTWIAPDNITLSQITGINLGLGLNPIPTFDWNRFVVWVDPLMMPYFTTFNTFIGSCIAFLTISGIYFTNSFYTSYLPINVNKPYDNMGLPYNISLVVDSRGIINETMYQAYSPPYLTASSITQYMFFFATYTATITYGFLYHWDELRMGFSDLINSFRPSKRGAVEQKRVLDVHNRLMKEYKEVPEWWYLIVLALAAVLGCVAISQWPTYTNPGVVFFGIAIALIFVVPIGIIMAMTGSEVSLNVLSEFIGGAWVEGNALSMCFFKTYGYITTHQALAFSNDLKVAHYLKIPPRITFAAQMVPALVSSFVCVAVVQYQIRLEGICTAEAPFKFTCPNISSYFTSAVLWGTVGPKRLWGVGGLYAPTLVGFPVGVVAVLIVYFLQKKFPKSSALRALHPVVIMTGGYTYSPYNLSHVWPAVPVAWFSWIYIKKRFLGLWSKVGPIRHPPTVAAVS